MGGAVILGRDDRPQRGWTPPADAGAGRGPGGLDDGLIETVRIRDGVAPLWYLHLRRLAESCRALGIPLPAS